MKILERIWIDIRNGENIDLYITIILVFSLVTLNLLGIASSAWIAPLTLAVLGLLAISNLGNRHNIEKLLEYISKTNDMIFLKEFPPSFNHDIQGATELWLVGMTLSQTIRHNYPDMEHALHEGHTIKVLLLHPSDPYLQIVASRSHIHSNVETLRSRILESLEVFCKLKLIAPDKLEIRTIKNPLGHGIIAVNPNSTSGVIYIANYPFKTRDGSSPKFVLRAKDGYWYDFYKEEFRILWNNGIEWQGNENQN